MDNYTLSTQKGRRLCIIDGGKDDGDIIYLDEKHRKNDVPYKYCKITDKGKFKLLPTNEKNQTDVCYYVGPRGCGKSYALSEYVKNYILLYPDNKVFLFSDKDEDHVLDDLINKRIDLKTYIEKGELTHNDFKYPCLVIFDDIDMLQNKSKQENLRTKIFTLMNQLIQYSRSKKITVIQTSHLGANREETQHVLNGCTSFTFFPAAKIAQVDYILKKYMGLNDSQIKKLDELDNTRVITLVKSCPKVVMTDKELFILDKKYYTKDK